MKIAVTAAGEDMSAQVDPRFGRAQSFIVCDTESGEWELVSNSVNLNAMQGAGIQTAQMLAKTGVAAVVTGHCGPKAFRVLDAAGIKVYSGASGTVTEALDAFKNGQLQAASGPDVEGHWQ